MMDEFDAVKYAPTIAVEPYAWASKIDEQAELLRVAREALEELVTLKDMKESGTNQVDYTEHKPKAWGMARGALAKLEGVAAFKSGQANGTAVDSYSLECIDRVLNGDQK